LPHWQQSGATYFLTFRLLDSLPSGLIRDWVDERKTWLRHHPKPWSTEDEVEYRSRFDAKIDQWIDSGMGSCLFKDRGCRDILEGVFRSSSGVDCCFHAWVIMPNHVHMILTMVVGKSLESLVKYWKGASARRINAHLARKGGLWQKDYHDRIVRNDVHLASCLSYIRRNPVEAKLDACGFSHYESEFARGISD